MQGASLFTSVACLRSKHRRQSGLKPGGLGSGSKKSVFPGNFSEKFRFLQAISQKISIFQARIDHLSLQQLLDKLFHFLSKVTTFEHTSCTVYMTRNNNISRPVHDPTIPSATPRPPYSKSGRRETPNPRNDAYWSKGLTESCILSELQRAIKEFEDSRLLTSSVRSTHICLPTASLRNAMGQMYHIFTIRS